MRSRICFVDFCKCCGECSCDNCMEKQYIETRCLEFFYSDKIIKKIYHFYEMELCKICLIKHRFLDTKTCQICLVECCKEENCNECTTCVLCKNDCCTYHIKKRYPNADIQYINSTLCCCDECISNVDIILETLLNCDILGIIKSFLYL